MSWVLELLKSSENILGWRWGPRALTSLWSESYLPWPDPHHPGHSNPDTRAVGSLGPQDRPMLLGLSGLCPDLFSIPPPALKDPGGQEANHPLPTISHTAHLVVAGDPWSCLSLLQEAGGRAGHLEGSKAPVDSGPVPYTGGLPAQGPETTAKGQQLELSPPYPGIGTDSPTRMLC